MMSYKTGKYDLSFREKKLEEIKASLAKEGYLLKSHEYINNRTKLEIECPHHHTWWASWDSIRSGKRCRQCYQEGIQKAVPIRKRTTKSESREQHRARMYARFVSALQAEGYKIISGEYINNRTKVALVCPRGHSWVTSWNQFSSGKRCKVCWMEDSRLTQEQVERELAAEGCELLDEYKGMKSKFKYRCACNRISYIRLPDFRKGVRCPACGGEKRRKSLRLKRIEKLNAL